MNIVETDLPGVLIVKPNVFGDERGFFVETFREAWLATAGVNVTFVQDNQSRSRRGVLRGLHFQRLNPQGKLVRVARGAVFDVAVDVREGSPTFGRWVGVILDDVHHEMLWIPPGFAHGFCVLSEEADFAYKCTTYYDPHSDAGVRWSDPAIGIEWLVPTDTTPKLSDKDRALPLLSELEPLKVATSLEVTI
ncbi:dTDP-4-dehydrorhamnose 3,5-epimerase [Paraburkholderia sp. RAU2J]|uniref:dTDP-4-dehydrorhamnose 3,5-epimerase n=1 Tax=Paraburkholderia sp. RAU2J TaxID=1938810 RepID=UPI000EB3226F|nr:dTDP-4-dehydrorhamnose 3,5-epimerase [Paraburkholderia sp. RAU2J]RKT10534.1 dTDP-4-dehydrorhamnose 3,5-epimerase [Paraburkholderia sp. RAU2J]